MFSLIDTAPPSLENRTIGRIRPFPDECHNERRTIQGEIGTSYNETRESYNEIGNRHNAGCESHNDRGHCHNGRSRCHKVCDNSHNAHDYCHNERRNSHNKSSHGHNTDRPCHNVHQRASGLLIQIFSELDIITRGLIHHAPEDKRASEERGICRPYQERRNAQPIRQPVRLNLSDSPEQPRVRLHSGLHG